MLVRERREGIHRAENDSELLLEFDVGCRAGRLCCVGGDSDMGGGVAVKGGGEVV